MVLGGGKALSYEQGTPVLMNQWVRSGNRSTANYFLKLKASKETIGETPKFAELGASANLCFRAKLLGDTRIGCFALRLSAQNEPRKCRL